MPFPSLPRRAATNKAQGTTAVATSIPRATAYRIRGPKLFTSGRIATAASQMAPPTQRKWTIVAAAASQ
jgi:hypothetical protein